jgi:hypothetical protein
MSLEIGLEFLRITIGLKVHMEQLILHQIWLRSWSQPSRRGKVIIDLFKVLNNLSSHIGCGSMLPNMIPMEMAHTEGLN